MSLYQCRQNQNECDYIMHDKSLLCVEHAMQPAGE